MKPLLILTLALALFSCGPDYKTESINPQSFYPDGPTVWNGDIFYVEYSKDRIMKFTPGNKNIEEKKNQVFYKQKGCGPASTVVYKNQLVVSCYDSSKLLFLNIDGQLVQEIQADSQGKDLIGPNDFAVHPSGTLFFTSSGIFDPNAKPAGKIYYCKDNQPIRIAGSLHYPAGIAFSPDGNTLYVAEHLAGKISYGHLENSSEGENGTDWKVDTLSVFHQFGEEHIGQYSGPDGLKTDSGGNLWVTLFGSGEIIQLSAKKNPDSTILKEITLDEKFLTNLFLKEKENLLILTAATDAFQSPYSGTVIMLDLGK